MSARDKLLADVAALEATVQEASGVDALDDLRAEHFSDGCLAILSEYSDDDLKAYRRTLNDHMTSASTKPVEVSPEEE